MGETAELTFLIFAAATLYSSVGHAGASGYLAAMAIVGLAPEAMKPTALALNILVATIATVRYVRAGNFDWHTFWPFILLSVPCAFIGGAIHLPSAIYKPFVGIILLIAAIEMARTAHNAAKVDATESSRRLPLIPALLCGGVIGLLSGLTGTGGGIFLSPVLLVMGWAATRRTSGISAAFILLNSIAGLAGAVSSLMALPSATPLWLVAAATGGLLGTQLGNGLLPTPTLRYLLAAVLVIAGLKLIFT